MKAFRVKGDFKDERQGRQPFTVEVAAENKESAEEQVLSTLGSRHKVKRWEISIESIEEVADDDIESPVVKYKVTGKTHE